MTETMFQQNVDFMKRFGDDVSGVKYADVIAPIKI